MFLLNDIKCSFFIVSFVLQISAIELNGSLSFFLHSREQLNHTTCVLQSFFAHSRTHARVSQNLSKRCKITPSSNQPQQMTLKSQVASIAFFLIELQEKRGRAVPVGRVVNDLGPAQRARLFPVEPGADTQLTEDVIALQQNR